MQGGYALAKRSSSCRFTSRVIAVRISRPDDNAVKRLSKSPPSCGRFLLCA